MVTPRACFSACNTPTALRRIHGWLTLGWLLSSIPILLWFRDSIPIVIFISVYANVVGHWSGWQAARTEVKQDEQGGE